MNKTRHILTAVFWLPVVMAAVVATACETDTIVLTAALGSTGEFMAVTLMELLTVTLIPAALYMFQTAGIRASLKRGKWTSLCRWGTLRMLMITIPMLADTLLYYIYMNTSFAYMAIICLICMIFVYPSERRCANEISVEE